MYSLLGKVKVGYTPTNEYCLLPPSLFVSLSPPLRLGSGCVWGEHASLKSRGERGQVSAVTLHSHQEIATRIQSAAKGGQFSWPNLSPNDRLISYLPPSPLPTLSLP